MNRKRRITARTKCKAAGIALAVALSGGGVPGGEAQNTSTIKDVERQATMTTQNKFYCNIKALTPAERVHHDQLTDKLVASRNRIVETEKGYEFQYHPQDVSLADLADWVAAEGKCCPFFDFHIDVEREGRLLGLRLTGEDGVKAFIRTEFRVPAR